MGVDPVIICDAALIVAVCRLTRTCAMLTRDGRILVKIQKVSDLIDITTFLPDSTSRELLDGDTEILLRARTSNSICTIAIKGRSSISFIDVGTVAYNGNLTTVYLGAETFESGFSFSLSAWHAVVRDNNNHVRLIKIKYTSTSSEEIGYPDAGNIREIVCSDKCTVLLIENGTVFASGLFDDIAWPRPFRIDIYISKTFKPLEFPAGICIDRVITGGPQFFFITIEGLCYYLNSNVREAGYPILINALTNYHIENIFIMEKHVIFQYDGGRLCLLPLVSHRFVLESIKEIDPDHLYGTSSPQLLPFCDNLGVVSVGFINKMMYVIASDGRVYCGQLEGIETQPLIEIPFFVDNPAAVRDHTAMIRSALSVRKSV